MSEHEYEMHRAYILAQVSSAVACLATFNSLESIDKNYSPGRKLGTEREGASCLKEYEWVPSANGRSRLSPKV